MTSGIINVLKPAGITSNAVLSRIKRILKPNKIGHLGTLDPSASGVLPVCINKATKLFDYFLKKDKVYRTIFVFGKETDTLDSDGKITQCNDKIVSRSEIESILPKLLGKQVQIPPQYSAKKVNGKKAYDIARSGESVELAGKEVEIFDINLVQEITENMFLFEIHCSSGTYVRSIARDMAKLLGTFAYAGAILRTKSGAFEIQDAVKLDDVDSFDIISLENILENNQKIELDDDCYERITNGCEVYCDFDDLQCCNVFCKNQLIGIGKIENKRIRIITNLQEKND